MSTAAAAAIEGAQAGDLERRNVEELLGFRPPAIVSLGGTDCRFWRAAGVPAYVYGSPAGMRASDESVASTSSST